MSDIDQGGGPFSVPTDGNEGQPPAPGVRILAQFIRDLSFENPNAPDSLAAGTAQPQMDLGVEMNARGRPDGLFEMDLKLTASATREGTAVFHCELLYGGLFQIGAQNEMDTEVMLMTECPRYLFPFARQIVAELSAQGGFPPFMIEPIDFAAIYLAQRAQANQQPIGQA